MMLLLVLILTIRAEPGRCQQDGDDPVFTFDEEIHNFATDAGAVYVATEKKLYQLRSDLSPVRNLDQKGILKNVGDPGGAQFFRILETEDSNATFAVNILVPFPDNRTLVTCGVTSADCGVTDNECGYCEVLDLEDITEVVYSENVLVGPSKKIQASVGFLVTVTQQSGFQMYILATKQSDKPDSEVVNLANTNDGQDGKIFSQVVSNGIPAIRSACQVEFVDGFQLGDIIYLFANVPTAPTSNKVRILWLESKKNKAAVFGSLRGASLEFPGSGSGSRLLASSLVSVGMKNLWSGVFSVDGGDTNTQLVLFDISSNLPKDADSDFCGKKGQPFKSLQPEIVLFKQIFMTSVLAVTHNSWMVFFIGTRDGQLIKLVVDQKYRTACPKVLDRASHDRKTFPKMHLDKTDSKHFYVAFGKQIKRVPVSRCHTYSTLQDCWAAQDPYCVWCSTAQRCMIDSDCLDSMWLSIPDDFSQKKMVSHKVEKNSSGQIMLHIQTHLTAGQDAKSNFACEFSRNSILRYSMESPPPKFPQCTRILSTSTVPHEGIDVTVKIRLGKEQLLEELKLTNCSDIKGTQTSDVCRQCVSARCSWGKSGCSWVTAGHTSDSDCHMLPSGLNLAIPEISSITPSTVSFYGRNHAVMTGRNLSDVIRVRIQADMDCTSKEFPVWNNTGGSLMFHIPSAGTKGVVKLCAVLPDGSCHGNAKITYRSLPSCNRITPQSTWVSGKRKITIRGYQLGFVEGVVHDHHGLQEVSLPTKQNSENLTYETPPAKNAPTFSMILVKAGNETVNCSTIMAYYPDPKFTTFTSMKIRDNIQITIKKEDDKLEMKPEEVLVWGVHKGNQYPCEIKPEDTSNATDFFICDIQSTPKMEIQYILIKYGDKTVRVDQQSSAQLFLVTIGALLLIPCIFIVVFIIYRRKQKKFTAKMNKRMEDLELDIRNDIRQGFVDLQTEKADLMENVGAVPFLDYKHFASRIFFPENEQLMKLCLKDIGQDLGNVQPHKCCQALSRLIKDRLFLTSMVHALEEQKSFGINEKCTLASLLTVALHSNLSYLTEVMEVLLKALMQQNSNTQPKLLLRRTASTVEKLLTNWMSICLYGFLRESVGQHLFLMVSALMQQIAKGPVDSVTEKALYTLSEDWLLWQAQDFSTLKLKVLFAVGTEGEVSEPLEVKALSCDTVGQLKEKILTTFKAKFGFPYNPSLRDICVEYEKDGLFIPLQEVDETSEVLGEVTMLNTLKHYQVPDGASIKVLSRKTHPTLSQQGSIKDDQDFSGKYFHLIDPDVEKDQRKNPERKKLKLKEVYLTKLVSTKVAVHSFVENLFMSILGTTQGRAPHAVKYFFDFLDAQADNMKLTDPDVLHIWKTNSLPLRFWVNILKNPQFVFDMEKTPHVDGCLSVIAQAFMDSFSLSDTQLGKYSPTNKLLYANDIPKYKQEVKAYYKQVQDEPPITAFEFKEFLLEETKKHENEFNEDAALRELYKYIQQYFIQIKQKLDQTGAPAELKEQLNLVKNLFDGTKSCSWN
ncbi:plexin-C1 [Thalassophryne amazonica]|uniref:plexin-C1 n=1 Tax=Thalassophryne amazonica TaxID=390379 RepID=UPI001472584B|nr:plexin-C1 [Thalassophryne amazonica]